MVARSSSGQWCVKVVLYAPRTHLLAKLWHSVPLQDKIARVVELEEELGRVRTGLQDAWSAHSDAVRGAAVAAAEHTMVVRTLQEQLRAANLGAVRAASGWSGRVVTRTPASPVVVGHSNW